MNTITMSSNALKINEQILHYIYNYRIYYNTQSTMKIPKHNTNNKTKAKPKHKPHHLEQQFDSDNIPSDPEPIHSTHPHQQQDYRTPEEVKIALAKKLIHKTKTTITKNKQYQANGRQDKQHDDFFVVDEPIPKGKDQVVNPLKTGDEDDDLIAEQLKNQYLRSKNKLYVDQAQYYRNMKIKQSTSYKGHTKCITAVEATEDKIFSASKDRSIISWDRQTGKKDFITMAKQYNSHDHEGPILCMSYHPMHQMIATAGEDGKIKLWDVRNNSLIDTLKGHRNTVNGIKFGFNSNNLCSVSSDRTLKQWECAQRGIIQTYYGHNGQVLDIDCINQNDFVSCGNDHQNIVWKTAKQTQLIFEGHDYAIDRVRAINEQKFISASQDGSINLWSQKKKKAIYKHPRAHDSWIVSLDCIKQSNVFASGGCEGLIKVWAIGSQLKNFENIHQIKAKGIVTDLKINEKQIIAASSDEHRLGRWLTHRVRNQIQVFKFSHQ